MANKTLKTRIINKHDTQTNWAKAVNFIPKAGEVIVYTDLHKVKVGDGTTKVSALPFIDDKDLSNYVTESELTSSLNNKVDKVAGKQLSTNDYTTTEKNKLAGIENGAQKNTVTSVAGKTGAVTLSIDDIANLSSTIPTVNNATITIQQNGTTKGTFTLNQSGNTTISLTDNNNTYSIATSSILGLVKSSTTGSTSGRDYKVQVNSDGTMKVNVPWTDTKYTLPSDVVHDSDLDNYATTSYVNQQIGNVKKAALQVAASRPSTGAEGTIYLVGSSAPYEMWTYENDVWIDLGSTEIDLSGYVPTSRKINGHALTADITITKSDVSLGNVVNTGDSATPTNGGTTKFTTGGAYTMQTTLQNAINGKANTNHTHTISQITGLESYLTYEDLGTI